MLQVATLDKWSTHIARPIIKYDGSVLVWLFLFIAVSRYGVLNVAIGTIAEATGRNVRKQMNTVNDLVAEAEFNVVAAIERGVQRLGDDEGRLEREKLMAHLARPSVIRQFKCVNINVDYAKELFDSCAIVDADMDHCQTHRYCEGIVELKGDARSLQCLKLLKLAQATEKSSARATESVERQAEMIDDICDRVEEFWMKFFTPKVPEVPEHMSKQVKRNLKLVNAFFHSIFGVTNEEDKLMKWLTENRYAEEIEDLQMLRDDRATPGEVRSMLEARGR